MQRIFLNDRQCRGGWQRARGCLGLGGEREGPQHLIPTIRAKWLLGSWQLPGSWKTIGSLRQDCGCFYLWVPSTCTRP